ncbi:MAG: VanZ family protein [bacterium]|nr:VanZ family protein [bacterium]
MKKYVLLVLIILWMGVIFIFSSKTGSESTKQSDGFISITIGNIVSIFDKSLTNEEKERIIDIVEVPIRKIAHITEYFILTILVSLFVNSYKISIKNVVYITFAICVLYSCSDEIHQLFVSDRSGQIIDVLIDSIGISIWLIIYYLYKRKEVLK